MIVVDLNKQQALDSDPKAIQQINFTANLNRAGNTRFYIILEKGLFLNFRNCKSIVNAIIFNDLIFINIKSYNTIV